MIKDSGERRVFDTGAVRDIPEGKGRRDLLPLSVVANLLEIDSEVLISIEYFKLDRNVKHLYDALKDFILEEYGGKTGLYADGELCMEGILNDSTCYISTAMLEVSKHFEEGAKKYGDNNWQKGIPIHSYINSAVGHYLKHIREDWDEPHHLAFIWNILCCIWTMENIPELDDLCKYSNNELKEG